MMVQYTLPAVPQPLLILPATSFWWLFWGTKMSWNRRKKEKQGEQKKTMRKEKPTIQQKPPRFCGGLCWQILTIELVIFKDVGHFWANPIDVTALILHSLGKRKTHKHKHFYGFVPGLSGWQNLFFCFLGSFLLGQKKTHKLNPFPQKNPGPSGDFLFTYFSSFIFRSQAVHFNFFSLKSITYHFLFWELFSGIMTGNFTAYNPRGINCWNATTSIGIALTWKPRLIRLQLQFSLGALWNLIIIM